MLKTTPTQIDIMPKFVLQQPTSVVKRDGRIVAFDASRIENVLRKCFVNSGIEPRTPLSELTQRAINVVSARHDCPQVEQIQDAVEGVLQAAGEYEAAKQYILYRAERTRLRQDRPIPDEVRAVFAESDHYFPTQLQKFQFYDKYSRFSYEHMRRETWVETVDRSMAFLRELSHNALPTEDYDRVRRAILRMESLPSMRLLAMAGPAARRNNLAIYNCSYMAVSSLDAFVEALIVSMSGCGVGFSVEQQYIDQLPRVERQKNKAFHWMSIDDSAEGWSDALRFGIEHWISGHDVTFNYSQIRPAGSPLLTKGGRASGPEPLRQTMNFVRSKILARQGGLLRSIDAHDMMCSIGNAAVSGGVRRTAMISLFDFDDQDMLHAKDNTQGNEQRWNSNNSAVWPDRELSQAEVTKVMLGMIESGGGEPGIFSRYAARLTLPDRREYRDFGTNPCVTGDTWIMTSDGPRQVESLVDQQFCAVIDGNEYHSTADGFFLTGRKSVYLIETVEGYTLRATADHPILKVYKQTPKKQYTEWAKVDEIREGDLIRIHNHQGITWRGETQKDASVAWLLGSLVGDGTFTRNANKSDSAHLRFWGEQSPMMVEMAYSALTENIQTRSDMHPVWHPTCKYWQLSSVGLADTALQYGIFPDNKTITDEIERSSSSFYVGFLRGLFDADGTVLGNQDKGISVRLSQSNLDLLQRAQRMLLRLGIASTIYQNRRDAGYRSLPDGNGGHKDYWTKDQHELVISCKNVVVFQQRVGFSDPDKAARLQEKIGNYRKKPDRERFVARIKSITLVGEDNVYDCTIPWVHAFDANGIYAHNCGEILLRDCQLCNLSIAVARSDDTFESLMDKVEIAAIIGTIQSMATHFPGMRSDWAKNCQEERLLGVDVNGQMDSEAARDPDIQRLLKAYAVDVNRVYAEKLGINQSVSVTCVKPSGNSSQLLDCSSGVHARWAPYYVRNVRVGTHTPMYKILRESGVPMNPENGQSADTAITWVVHFPVKAPEGAITRNDRGAIDQCNYWLRCKENYTEHNPSVTITYQPDEVIDLIQWVWKHQGKIGGMTFLPASDAQYDQMPYEEIGQAEYERLADQFPVIDFSKLYRHELEDYTTAAQELACMGGSCAIA